MKNSVNANCINGKSMRLKYKYYVVLSVRGFFEDPKKTKKDLIDDREIGIRVAFISNEDPLLALIDRRNAFAELMLASFDRNNLNPSLAELLNRNRTERVRKFGSKSYLLIEIDGVEENFNASRLMEYDDFIACFDGADLSKIRKTYQHLIKKVMNSISLSIPKFVGFERLMDTIIFLNNQSKPIYSYTGSVGKCSAYVSSPLTDDQTEKIQGNFHSIINTNWVNRIFDLQYSSYDVEESKLRAFVSAWSALEMFVQIVFKEKYFPKIDELLTGNTLSLKVVNCIDDIKNRPAGRHSLRDKFVIISYFLNPDEAELDQAEFKAAKTVRDSLFHGQIMQDDELPLEKIQSMFAKYFNLDITAN